MKIKQALQEYLLETEVRKYTPKTIRSYRNNLNLPDRVVAFCFVCPLKIVLSGIALEERGMRQETVVSN